MIASTAAIALSALLTATAAAAQSASEAPASESRPQEQSQAQPKSGSQAEQGALSKLAHDVMAAQQMGYLAADKNVQAAHAMLGDQMALVNSQINQSLDRLVAEGNLNLPRTMDQDARGKFEQMKEQNGGQFAQSLVAFVNETYPRMLDNIDALAREMPDSPVVANLVRDAAPRLREQMQTARQLALGEGDQQKAQMPDRGPIQRKDDPAAIPDTTAR